LAEENFRRSSGMEIGARIPHSDASW